MTIKEKTKTSTAALSEEVAATPVLMGEATPVPASQSTPVTITPPVRIAVVSPSTLQEGDTVEACINGIRFFARVPEGGVQQGEMFESVYPRFVRVVAPETRDAGDRFKATYEGVRFIATVPAGGCRYGDMIETLHPSVAPPYNAKSERNLKITIAVCWIIGLGVGGFFLVVVISVVRWAQNPMPSF